MKANARRLKQLVQDAAHHAGANFRKYRDEFDIDELFEAIKDSDDPRTIAATAMSKLCCREGGFNRNAAGLKAVMRFLAETSSQQPESNADVTACLTDLKDTLNRVKVDEEIGDWVDRWFQF
jgi:hypothetical protein